MDGPIDGEDRVFEGVSALDFSTRLAWMTNRRFRALRYLPRLRIMSDPQTILRAL